MHARRQFPAMTSSVFAGEVLMPLHSASALDGTMHLASATTPKKYKALKGVWPYSKTKHCMSRAPCAVDKPFLHIA